MPQTGSLAPTTLEPGTYTQLRLGVSSAVLRVKGADIPLAVPSEKVRTDRNFELLEGGAVALTVDFDLSRSIVATGSGQYHFKPVLHLVETARAVSIVGDLADATFDGTAEAQVVVTRDADGSGGLSAGDEEHTRLAVPKANPEPTRFHVLWLMPSEGYTVRVEVGGVDVYTEFVAPEDLPPGADFALNGGAPI